MTTWRALSEGFLGVVERGTTMLQLLRTARTGKGKGRSPGDGDLLGVFWGAGILELFVLQGDSMRTWRSPDSISDVVHLLSGIEEGLGALGCRPHRAVILLLHPDLQQLRNSKNKKPVVIANGPLIHLFESWINHFLLNRRLNLW